MSRPLLTATVEIVEQPVPEYEFLYPPEVRADQNVPLRSVNIAIRVNGYVGNVKVVASCVNKDAPYRAHPFKLVGRPNCRHGVYTREANITAENRIVLLQNIGIRRVRISDVNSSLRLREIQRIEPFIIPGNRNTGKPGMHDVRLAIQVFGVGTRRSCNVPLHTLVTDVISDPSRRLRIIRISHTSGSARGNTEIIMITEEQLPRDTVTVRFEDPATGWFADVHPTRILRGILIFNTPPYSNPDTLDPILVHIYLRRAPLAGRGNGFSTSNRINFEYLPCPQRKRLSIPEPHSKRQKTIDKKLHTSLGEFENPQACSSSSVDGMNIDEARQQESGEIPLAHPDSRRYIFIEILDAYIRSQYNLIPSSTRQTPLDISLLDLPLGSGLTGLVPEMRLESLAPVEPVAPVESVESVEVVEPVGPVEEPVGPVESVELVELVEHSPNLQQWRNEQQVDEEEVAIDVETELSAEMPNVPNTQDPDIDALCDYFREL